MADTWTTKTSLTVAKFEMGDTQSGSENALASAGGILASATNDVELYSLNTNTWTTKSSTPATFSRRGSAQSGTIDQRIFGGKFGNQIHYFYDGTGNSWSNKTVMNLFITSNVGTQSGSIDALSSSGSDSSSNPSNKVEFYDGTGNSWSSKSDIPSKTNEAAGCKSGSTDARCFGGNNSVYVDFNFAYDSSGDSWSTKTVIPQDVGRLSSATNNVIDALIFGGIIPGGTFTATTRHYDSGMDAWSSRANLNTARAEMGGSRMGSDGALSYGGVDGSVLDATEYYEGFAPDGITRNTLYSTIPIEIEKGGTAADSLTAFAVLCSGTTTTGSIQPVASLGTAGQVLESQGAGAFPQFATADTNISTNIVSSDPGAPSDGDFWFNTTSGDFKGQASSSTVTFTVT